MVLTSGYSFANLSGRDGLGWRPAAVWRTLQSRQRAGLDL
jgi:hypothetical protein